MFKVLTAFSLQAVAFEKRLRKTGHYYLDAPIVGGGTAENGEAPAPPRPFLSAVFASQ